MTIKDAVNAAIARMPGNKTFRTTDLGDVKFDAPTLDAVVIAEPSRIARCIREHFPHVQRDGKGNYRVKGRRVCS